MEAQHDPTPVFGQQSAVRAANAEQEGKDSRSGLRYQAALAIDLDNSRRKDKRNQNIQARLASELGDNTSEAEALSYRLFTDSSLSFADHFCAGTYNLWGDFLKADEGAAAARFPSLAELSSIKYVEGDIREVVLVDHRTDSRLRQVEGAAAEALSGCIREGALACVQAVARVACDHLGGASTHAELSARYTAEVVRLKRGRRSLVVPIGELRVGVSRHRALLLKALLDECSFPCRILRGSSHLGTAGASGEASIAVVRIHAQEYMVDLVTEPGRMTPLQQGGMPLPASAAAWTRPADSRTMPSNTGASLPEDHGAAEHSGRNPEGHDGGFTKKAGLRSPDTLQQAADSLSGDVHASSSAGSRGIHPKKLGSTPNKSAARRSIDRDSLELGLGPCFVEDAPQLIQFPSDTVGIRPDLLRPFLQASSAVWPDQQAYKSDEGPRHAPQEVDNVTRQASAALSEDLSLQERAAERRLSFTQGCGGTARVRGRDRSGTIVYFDLEAEGLTVTHQVGSSTPQWQQLPDWPVPQQPSGAFPSPFTNLVLPSPFTNHIPARRSGDSSETASSDPRGDGDQRSLPPQQPSAFTGTLQQTPCSPSNSGPLRGGEEGPSEHLDEAGGRVLASPATSFRSGGSTQKSSVSWGGSGKSTAPTVAEHMAAVGVANLMLSREREMSLGLAEGTTRSQSATPTFFDVKGFAPSMQDFKFQQRKQQSDREREEGSSPLGPITSSSGGYGKDAPAAMEQEVDDAEIEFSSLELGTRIGMGCWGEVFKGQWRQTTVAVKMFLDQSLSEQTLREFKAEVRMNRRLRHPNIIAFLGACTVRPHLCIVTAWAPRGSLYQLLHNSGPMTLTARQKLRMALDTARGMHYLHSAKPPIIHRDLKSLNVLVDNDLTIKVCDFGLARVRSDTWAAGRSQGGTPEWTAPEVLRNQSWSEKSDVYSYGVILFELVSGQKPWSHLTPMQVVGAVGWGNARLECPPDCPAPFAGMMARCCGEAAQRPSFKDIIQELIQYANKDHHQGSVTNELAASTPATAEQGSYSVVGMLADSHISYDGVAKMQSP